MITTATLANLSALLMGSITGAGFQTTLKGYLTKVGAALSLICRLCNCTATFVSDLAQAAHNALIWRIVLHPWLDEPQLRSGGT